MVYLVFLALISGTPAVTLIEFDNVEACETAREFVISAQTANYSLEVNGQAGIERQRQRIVQQVNCLKKR